MSYLPDVACRVDETHSSRFHWVAAAALTLASGPLRTAGTPAFVSLNLTTVTVEGQHAQLGFAIDYVDTLCRLPDNWNGHGAEAPSETAAVLARAALEALSRVGLIPDRIAQSVEGGIAIAFFRGQKYADFECFNAGEMLASTSDRVTAPRVWGVHTNEAPTAAAEIRRFLDA